MRADRALKPGAALFAAIVALAIVAALLTAAFFSALEADRSARRLERHAAVRAIAERGLEIALSQWNAPARVAQGVGSTTSLTPPPRVANTSDRVWATRISTHAFWLYARATDDLDSATSAGAGLIVRLEAPRFPRLAALVSRGAVRFDGPASVSGDAGYGVGPCDSAAAPLDGILVPPGVSAPPSAGRSNAAASESTYTWFGGVDLVARAGGLGATVPAGSTIAPPSAPLLLALGDLTVGPGIGSGVLIVQGRLRLLGPVQFSGVLIATNGFEIASGDVTISGLVMSGAANDSSVVVNAGGRIDLQYSECAVRNAELANSVARPSRTNAHVPLP
jgi:type II secretory pathway pseudopilin PulG